MWKLPLQGTLATPELRPIVVRLRAGRLQWGWIGLGLKVKFVVSWYESSVPAEFATVSSGALNLDQELFAIPAQSYEQGRQGASGTVEDPGRGLQSVKVARR